jgi:hypothetical protein
VQKPVNVHDQWSEKSPVESRGRSSGHEGIFLLFFLLQLALFLDIELRFLFLFLIAFIAFTTATHDVFSFRANDGMVLI